MWKSHHNIEAFIRDAGYPPTLARLYALRTFWRNAVFPEGYQVSEAWPHILSLSDAGRVALGLITPVTSAFPKHDVLLALFGKLFHHEIFFDWERSDLEAIRTLLEQELHSTKIRIPHSFGRLLYDRFNDLHEGSHTQHLLTADVQLLLDRTPQGLAQVGKLLVGPLGILDSLEARYLPPTLSRKAQ